MAQQPSKWIHQHNRSAYFPKWKKNSEVCRRNNNGPKALPCGTPDTTLTSLLQQPSTITCCDRFDRNCVNIDKTEPPMPQSRAYREYPDGWPYQRLHCRVHCPIKGLPTLQCTLQYMGHEQKSITGTHTFPISKLGGWKHTTALHKSFKTNRHQALKHLRQYWCYGNWLVIGNRRGRCININENMLKLAVYNWLKTMSIEKKSYSWK